MGTEDAKPLKSGRLQQFTAPNEGLNPSFAEVRGAHQKQTRLINGQPDEFRWLCGPDGSKSRAAGESSDIAQDSSRAMCDKKNVLVARRVDHIHRAADHNEEINRALAGFDQNLASFINLRFSTRPRGRNFLGV